jgi:hypothetical protein
MNRARRPSRSAVKFGAQAPIALGTPDSSPPSIRPAASPMHRAPPRRRPLPTLLLMLAAIGVAGCDQLGIESASDVAARRDADGKAVGGACRHAGRAIEDCFALNKRSDRSAILAGWREMNDYMAERQLAPLAPIGASPVASAQPVGDGVPTATAREPAAAASAVPAARAPKPAARADG